MDYMSMRGLQQPMFDESAGHQLDGSSSQSSNDSLMNRYERLIERNNELSKKYNGLREDHQNLEKSCNTEMQRWRMQCTNYIQKWQELANEKKELIQQLDESKQTLRAHEQAYKRKCEELKLVQKEKSEITRDHELVLGERDSVHKEIETLREQLMERNNVLAQIECDYKLKVDEIASLRAAFHTDHTNHSNTKEADTLKKQIDALTKELADVKAEAAVNIERRDWAMDERAKVVQERESIRKQCDELRRERDRAVSSHAEVLRELDSLKKYKSSSAKELQDLRERLEKEERKNQLVGQSVSRDSAIDNDYQDWDTQTLEFDIDLSSEGDNLGIDLSTEGSNSSDAATYINHVQEGSPCDGKLKVNDIVLTINGVDVGSSSKDIIKKSLNEQQSQTLSIKVRRKIPISRCNVTVELNLNKKDHGLQLENGVYISKIPPGSALAKDGNVAVGDRVLAVGDKLTEHKAAKDVMKMIENSGDYVTLSIGKYGALPPDNMLTHSSSSSLLDKIKKMGRSSGSEKNLHKHVDDSSDPTRKRKGQGHPFKSFWKGNKRSGADDDDPDTIKLNTDQVMKILDMSIADGDRDSKGTWPSRSGGVELSTHGTVTVRPRSNAKPIIPESMVNPSEVYGMRDTENFGKQYQSGFYSEGATHLYEPKTLPSKMKSCQIDPRSNSLDGHTRQANYNDLTTDPNRQSSAHSLDLDVKTFRDIYRTRNKNPRIRPISAQPLPVRTISPNDFNRGIPSSPSRHTNRSFTPESSGSRTNSLGYQQYHQQHSIYTNDSSNHGNSQISVPSKPHQVKTPSYMHHPPGIKQQLPTTPTYMSGKHSDGNIGTFYMAQHSTTSPSYPYQSQTLDRKFGGTVHATPVKPLHDSYSTARLKFPSNTSMSSSNKRSLTSNSQEIVSNDSSPLSSPLPSDVPIRSSEESIQARKHRSYQEGVLHAIELDSKSSSRYLGIQIDVLQYTGVFVKYVEPDSLAAEVGIVVGDQIVEFCGINMQTATYKDAEKVLLSRLQVNDKVRMMVQYNPQRLRSFAQQVNDGDRNSVTGSIQKMHVYMGNDPPPYSVVSNHRQQFQYSKKSLDIVHSNGSSCDETRNEPVRKVFGHKMTPDAGVKLKGGNATGVFIAEISQYSCFYGLDLRVGDQILAINGKDVVESTAEQISMDLNRATEMLALDVRYNIHGFSCLPVSGGDQFYVKAHFNYKPDNNGGLSIDSGDILLVENSLVDGQFGRWYVRKVDSSGNKYMGGIVPSKSEIEKLKRNFYDMFTDDDSKSSKRNGSIGRRSFFKRRSGRNQHQRSGSRDSRELISFTDLSSSSDNVPSTDDEPRYYQRVEEIDCRAVPRPVVIFGPFANILIQKLVSESPDKYTTCKQEVMNASFMEKYVSSGIIDHEKVNDHYKVITATDLHDIAASNRHCLLVVQPAAIEKMHKCNLYPIVIYIRHKSPKQVKDVKDPRFLPEKLSSKSAKDLFEFFQKVEIENSNIFTVEIQGSNMAAMSQEIKKVVAEEQKKLVWI